MNDHHRTSLVLTADRMLDDAERARFLGAFTLVNPHWRGAHVADILDELRNCDAHLDRIEAAFDEAGDVPTEDPHPSYVALAVLLAAYMHLGTDQSREWRPFYDRLVVADAQRGKPS